MIEQICQRYMDCVAKNAAQHTVSRLVRITAFSDCLPQYEADSAKAAFSRPAH